MCLATLNEDVVIKRGRRQETIWTARQETSETRDITTHSLVNMVIRKTKFVFSRHWVKRKSEKFRVGSVVNLSLGFE